MAKNYNTNRISKRRTYTVKEVAVLLSVHTGTVQNWLHKGLEAVENSFPYLIQGEELALYLKEIQNKRKCKLALGEFYCFRCHQARKGLPGKTQTITTGKRIGKDKISIQFKSLCEICGIEINRYGAKYTTQVVELLGTGVNLANVDIKDEKI